jgi:hypothetical protein
MTLADQLRELEQSLLRNEVRRDPARASALIADDFREFGRSGRIFDKPLILKLLQEEPPIEVKLHDFVCVPLAEQAALVTYRTVRLEPDDEKIEALRSSVWVLRDNRWQVLFHQGTRTTIR